MLRIHFLQQWYALSDPGMEEALYDTPVMRRFARLGGLADIPDETTIIAAPSSTKNRDGERDPEMCQTRKGNPVALRYDKPEGRRTARSAGPRGGCGHERS